MRAGFPKAGPGQIVGLLGGSFDPPHRGHVHITRTALARFALDRVWWLVSPGNPLKARQPAPMARRIAIAREKMRHPRVEISDIEARIGTRYTAETLRALARLYPRVRFVWLMGGDNLASFHHWEAWQEILGAVPVGVLARPGAGLAPLRAPAARAFRDYRLASSQSRMLGRAEPPAWCHVNLPLMDISSSVLRSRGDWALDGEEKPLPRNRPVAEK